MLPLKSPSRCDTRERWAPYRVDRDGLNRATSLLRTFPPCEAKRRPPLKLEDFDIVEARRRRGEIPRVHWRPSGQNHCRPSPAVLPSELKTGASVDVLTNSDPAPITWRAVLNCKDCLPALAETW